MRLFGHWLHKTRDPWESAPAWAIELREQGAFIIYLLETILMDINTQLTNAENSARSNADAEDAIIKLLNDTRQMVADLKQSGTDPETAARIEALSNALAARGPILAQAVVEGTSAQQGAG